MARKCNCNWCDSTERRNFHGYQPEDEFDVPYKKKGGKKKGCKRSKDGQHDWTGKRFAYAYRQVKNEETGKYDWKRVYIETTCCAKCSKFANQSIYGRYVY